MSPMGSLLMFAVIGEFLGGMVIPVPLMPGCLQSIVNVLPFRYTADFPFRVYSGHIPSDEAVTGILIQLIWLTAIVVLGKIAMRKALGRVVAQGG